MCEEVDYAIVKGVYDPNRPVTQWNGMHLNRNGDHVAPDVNMRWHVETPAANVVLEKI